MTLSRQAVPPIDYLTRATDAGGQIRVMAARTTRLVEEARERHGTYPTVTAALGRVLTAGLLMGSLRKGKDKLTIRLLGDGPIGGIVVDATAEGSVRGYAKNPQVHVPLNPWGKLDVAAGVGTSGSLCVTYDLEMKEPYTGCSPIVSGEIAKDLVYYFYTSEQVPSIVALGVLVGWDGVIAAGGLLLQLLPGADKNVIPVLEKNAAVLSDTSRLVEDGKTPEDLVEIALSGLGVKFLGKQAVHFKCACSKDKLKNVLMALGQDEIKDLLLKEGKAEAVCPFCNHKYLLHKQEIQAMLDSMAS